MVVTQWWLEMGLVPNCLMSAYNSSIYACIYFAVYTIYIYIYIHTHYMHDTISVYIYIRRNTETYEFPSGVQMKPLCKLVSLRSSFDLFDASTCIWFFVSSKYPPVNCYQTILVNIDSQIISMVFLFLTLVSKTVSNCQKETAVCPSNNDDVLAAWSIQNGFCMVLQPEKRKFMQLTCCRKKFGNEWKWF